MQEIKVFNFSELNYLSLVNEQEIYEKFFSKYLNIDNKDLSCFFYKNKKAVYYLEEDIIYFTLLSEPNDGDLAGSLPNLTYLPNENWYGESQIFLILASI